MKGFTAFAFSALFMFGVVSHYNLIERFDTKAKVVNNYQIKALILNKEKQILLSEINDLKYKVKELEARNNFLELKDKKKLKQTREIASELPTLEDKMGKDHVKYEVYKWSPDKLLAIGDKEFQYNNFENQLSFFMS
jgi:phenylalanyl-tRNA synthetase alpha subunit